MKTSKGRHLKNMGFSRGLEAKSNSDSFVTKESLKESSAARLKALSFLGSEEETSRRLEATNRNRLWPCFGLNIKRLAKDAQITQQTKIKCIKKLAQNLCILVKVALLSDGLLLSIFIHCNPNDSNDITVYSTIKM